MNLVSKLKFNKSEEDFKKSMLKIDILVDLLDKELKDNYEVIIPGYKKQLKGITKTFENFKSQVNSTRIYNFEKFHSSSEGILLLEDAVETKINDVIKELYE